MNSSCIEKIKKLLSLATSDNANERDSALAKAQRIATENDVDLALLDLSDVGTVKEEEMIEDKFEIGRVLSAHKRFVAGIVTEVCGVEAVYWRNSGGRQISFLGPKSSVEFAKWLYGFLLDEYVRRWNSERKAHNLPAAHRNTLYLGIRDGQRQKIRQEKEAAERSTISRHAAAQYGSTPTDGDSTPVALEVKTVELTQKYALVVQGQTERRKDFLRKVHPKLGTLRSSAVRVRCHDTYSAGTSHGRLIGLNRPLQ